jgi:hypothetical protein
VQQTYYPQKRNVPEPLTPETRTTTRHALATPGRLTLAAPRAVLDMHCLAQGAATPTHVDLWPSEGQNAFNGSPERGDRHAMAPMVTAQVELHGREVTLTSILDARPHGEPEYVQAVEQIAEAGIDHHVLRITHTDGVDTLIINEAAAPWTYAGTTYPQGIHVLNER